MKAEGYHRYPLHWSDWRTIVAIVALGLAGFGLHKGYVEEQARTKATCIASTESREEIKTTFQDLTQRLLRRTGDAGDINLANKIDDSVRKTLGSTSPLCQVG